MTVKTMYLLRHAKAAWGEGLPDYERELTERGLRDARTAGRLLASRAGATLDLVWCSAATRTEQTWEQARLGGVSATRVESRQSFYDTWAEDILAELTTLEESVRSILLIGHQPTVGQVVVLLAKPSSLVDQVAAHYPTAGLATLTFDGTWPTLRPGSALLTSFDVAQG